MRAHIVCLLEVMDSFAYFLLSHTVCLRERTPQSSSLSFQLDRDVMDYALPMVQFLLKPDLHLIHARRETMVESRISEFL